MVGKPVPFEDRVWSKVDASGDCWEWTGSVSPQGYGHVRYEGVSTVAHRAVYQHLVGPIGHGLDLDHLCRNRKCVNPDHLEPVSRKTNIGRGIGPALLRRDPRPASQGERCGRGLHLMAESADVSRSGRRKCGVCAREQAPIYRARHKERKRQKEDQWGQ